MEEAGEGQGCQGLDSEQTLPQCWHCDFSENVHSPFHSGAGAVHLLASPMLRVKAVPGYVALGAHSLGGSPSFSSSVPQISMLGS